MTLIRKANLEAALMGDLLVIVRGSASFNIPADEISDLSHLLSQFNDVEIPTGPSDMTRLSPTRLQAPGQKRRGRLWEAVRKFLAVQDRALGFKTLLKYVKQNSLTDRDPSHALKIALGKKVSSGELLLTPSGRYALPIGAPVKTSDGAKPVAKKRHRPGALWMNMRNFLAKHPDGVSRDSIVAAAEEGTWTTASSVEHAVKICLSRVGDQVQELQNGNFRLSSATATATPARIEGTVRRRKKEDRAPVDVKFDAASRYHMPRSRQPR